MSDKSKIPADIAAFAEKDLANLSLSITDNTGVIKREGSLVFTDLPEGLTKEGIEAAFSHVHSRMAAQALSFGRKCNEAAKENKELKTVTMDADLVGKDNWGLAWQRSKTFPVPGGTSEVTHHGVVTTKLDTYEARRNVGVLKNVLEEISTAAAAAFGGK